MAHITHQDIVQRVEALAKERSAAYQKEMARIDAEHKSLRELCGGIGHIFGVNLRHAPAGEKPPGTSTAASLESEPRPRHTEAADGSCGETDSPSIHCGS